MTPPKVVLLACGSFNPPTNMHLRMFELARDHIHRKGTYTVVGGIISPVHDAYGKSELVSSTDRCAMLKMALLSSDWIKLSDWECKQEQWTRTKHIIQYHQNQLNAIVNDSEHKIQTHINWLPDTDLLKGPIQVKLLCGADLLESFGTPGLWSDSDLDEIMGVHGIVVVSRFEKNPLKYIYESDLLYSYSKDIIIVPEHITNDISSTKIRRALRRNDSVKYLIADSVIEYIKNKKLYGTLLTNSKYLNNEKYNANNMFLTPSPSDVIMTTPSPEWEIKSFGNNNSTPPSYTHIEIDTVDALNQLNSAKSTHPGQAVKIVTDVAGDHKIISNKVGFRQVIRDHPITQPTETIIVDCANKKQLNITGTVPVKNDHINGTNIPVQIELDQMPLKSKSCHNFIAEYKCDPLKPSRSNAEINDCKSCDENLIKFIFTNHGIQVISDVETVV